METPELQASIDPNAANAGSQLRAMFEAIPVPTYTWQSAGNDFRLIDFNKKSMEFTRDRIVSLLGSMASSLYQDMPHIPQDMARCLQEKCSIERYMNYSLKTTGETRYMNVKYAFVPPDLVMVYTEDVTADKKRETALQESRDRLALAASSAKLGIWDWDVTKDILLWDEQMFQLYGVTERPEPMDVEVWKRGVHPDDIGYTWAAIGAALRGEKEYDIQFRIVRPDGTIRYLKADGIVVRDKDARPLRMIGINHDITDATMSVESRRKYVQQLHQNERLEALGVLAAGVAHDFNNLLGGIYGQIAIALDKVPDKPVSEPLSKAMDTIERARGLTLQLVALSREGAPSKEAGPLFPFVEETARFAVSRPSIRLQFSVPKDLWPALFDKTQIGQVVDNLVINAQQALPAAGTISISAANTTVQSGDDPTLAPGNYVRLSVGDSGRGMPADVLPRIFDPYYTTREDGNGLGLASCYSIVRRHGGNITVESTPGRGTIFHVLLPAAHAGTDVQSKAEDSSHHGTGRFLVMDDHDVVREIIGATLESFGYTVVYMTNGIDTLEFIRQETAAGRSFASMILDMSIPGGPGGRDIIGEIRLLCPSLPVFAASGSIDDPAILRPGEYGFTSSIQKPFRRSEFVDMLNKHVSAQP